MQALFTAQDTAGGIYLVDRQLRAIANGIADTIMPNCCEHDIVARIRGRFGIGLAHAAGGNASGQGAKDSATPQSRMLRGH